MWTVPLIYKFSKEWSYLYVFRPEWVFVLGDILFDTHEPNMLVGL